MRWRSASLTACSALLLAACGGSDNTFTTTQRTTTQERSGPPIAEAVAVQLALRSDEVARRLDAGDSCGAADSARKLREDLTKLINGQAIPAAYLEDLSGAVNELQAQIQCEPPPPRRGKDDDKGHGKHKGKDKKGDDD
jgi:hypothetical protein